MKIMLRALALAFISSLFGIKTLTLSPTLAVTNYTYPNVIVNELMPNPIGADSEYEWIELYNTTSSKVDLENWRLQGQLLSGEIEPHTYFIVARDEIALEIGYPNLDFYESNISLKNSGDTILLQNAQQETIDSFTYESAEEGKSFERIGVPGYADSCDEIMIHGLDSSIGQINSNIVENCFPEVSVINDVEISNIQFSFDGADYYDTVYSYGYTELQIRFDINVDEDQIESFHFYNYVGEELGKPLELDNYYNKSINVEVKLIDGSIITAESNDIYIYPELRITEVFIGEESWIELYNPNSYEVNLSLYELLFNDIKPDIQYSAECVDSISALSYCVIFTSQIVPPVALDLSVSEMVIQNLDISNLEDESNMSIYKDSWVSDINPTPGAENRPSDLNIIINEVYPSPNSGEVEWLELYNKSHYSINTEDWYLTEEINLDKCVANTTFSIEEVDGNEFITLNEKLGVSLNNGGDEIYLCNSDNQIISKVVYPEIDKGVSYARLLKNEQEPTAEFSFGSRPTPGWINEFALGNSGEESDTPINSVPIVIDKNTKLNNLDYKLVYTEGEIVSNFGSSFDIQTPVGVFRVGFQNIDKPERSKGDYVKVAGFLEMDGEVIRIIPRSNGDLEIIPKQEESKVSTKTSVKKSAGSISGINTKISSSIKEDKFVLPSNIFKINKLGKIDENKLSENSDTLFFGTLFAVIILLLYAIYISEFDKRVLNYLNTRNEEEISYFTTTNKRQKIPRRRADLRSG